MMKRRDVHDLSNYAWSSMKAGELSPIKVTEVLPGDTIKMRSEAVIRLDALNTPTMHPLKVKLFHFYQPNRLAWPNWNDFITQGYNGADASVHPYITVDDTMLVGALMQRLGLPVCAAGQSEQVSAFPVHMYYNVYDKYFRDPNLQIPLDPILTDGDNTATFASPLYGLSPRYVNWKKDYFTTARANPEIGGAVPIPQSGIQRVDSAPSAIQFKQATTNSNLAGTVTTDGSGNLQIGGVYANFDPQGSLEMDETAVMRDLSIAGALQIFRENRAEWGSRIIDYLRKGFGSKVSSYELGEPILLNYGEKTIQFSEVLQTAEGTDPVGTLRGHGVGGLGTNHSKYTVPEHGFIMTLAYIMPEPAYLSSAERHWFKTTFTDYFQQEFEHVGNMGILKKEISFGTSGNSGIFGYTNPYDDYRRSLNTVSGTFATTDKAWHMARDFAGAVPALNSSFTTGAPTQRIFADTTGEVYKVFAYNEIIARRIVKRTTKRRIL